MECIDILLATYNGEKYIKEQIDSILNQSYNCFRLLISDDCSTDTTRAILQEYSKNDDRIKVFYQEKNIGIVNNFEFLLGKVENNYFMFSDQDDYWKENKIKNTFEKLQKDDADLAYTDLEVVDENLNQISASYWNLKGLTKKIKKYNNFDSLYLNNYITGCTILCKSKWINTIIPIPKNSKNILHDYWIALQVSYKGKITYLDEPTIEYRQHGNNCVGSKTVSETMNSLDEIRKMFIDIKIDHFKTLQENNNSFDEKIKQRTDKSLQYFTDLANVKRINFKNWRLFFTLYKYENFGYLIKNFIILNTPGIGKIIFKIIKRYK